MFKVVICCLSMLLPLPASAFSFAPDGTTFSCTAEQKAKVMDVANAYDDMAQFAHDKLVSFGGANPPPSDGYRAEIEYWLGAMPDGDPMHPSADLGGWQGRLDLVADTLAQGRTAQANTDFLVICVADDFTSCVNSAPPLEQDMIDEFDDTRAHAFSQHLDMSRFGKPPLPVLGLCAAFFSIGLRGNYETQVAIWGHEMAHLFPGSEKTSDYAYGLADCHMLAGDDKSAKNGATVQFIIGGLDDRRMGGSGSTVVDVMMQAGCDVGGRRRGSGLCLLLVFALPVWSWRRALRRRHDGA